MLLLLLLRLLLVPVRGEGAVPDELIAHFLAHAVFILLPAVSSSLIVVVPLLLLLLFVVLPPVIIVVPVSIILLLAPQWRAFRGRLLLSRGHQWRLIVLQEDLRERGHLFQTTEKRIVYGEISRGLQEEQRSRSF